MNSVLKGQIQKWEHSGQGDDGCCDNDNNNDDDDIEDNNNDDNSNSNTDGEDAEFGNLRGRPRRALDLRRIFFDNKNTYLLYLWDVLDEHDLVQSSMQQLLSGIGSGNGSSGVPSVVGDKRKNNKDDSLASSKKSKGQRDDATAFSQLSSSIEKHSHSLVAAAQISAKEQEKNRAEARLEQERSRKGAHASELNARINALNDKKGT
jgi:hypothetical protein